nr:hypothetical protein [Mycobacterium botniense]
MTTKTSAGPAADAGTTDPAIRIVVLTLLAVDGILSALTAALLMPAYIGAVPFPVSALISGLVNAALVWAARGWTRSARVAGLPLWTWLLTVTVMSLGGPGDDIILGGRGVLAYSVLLLIAFGVVPPAWVLRPRRSGRRPDRAEPRPG